jgi:hypothetical protein
MLNTLKKICITSALTVLSACGGGGSNTSPDQPLITTIPTCSNPHSAEYPDEFIGGYAIPFPAAELNNQIKRGISFKDYAPFVIWNQLDDDIKSLCSQDAYTRLMYLEALEAMKASGAQRTWIYNYGPWNDSQADVWEVDESNYQIPNQYVEYVVEQASNLGIEVFFAWQFSNYDLSGEVFVQQSEEVTQETLTKILDAHQRNMIAQAKFAQKIGMAGISADWNAFDIVLTTDELKDYYLARFSEIIDDIRANFSGQITWGQIGRIYNDERIFSKIDSLLVNALWIGEAGGTFSQQENANLTAELIKQKTLKYLQQEKSNIYCLDTGQPCWAGTSSINLPAIISVQVQSREDYFINGWKEDGFCTSGTLEDNTSDDCMQEHYTTDFSLQALGIEGIMQALSEQYTFSVESTDIHTGYWLSQTLTPGVEGFPNLSQSIRGKPAEHIVKYWYTGQ